MDPITTTVLAAVGKLAEPAVKDAYVALKSLIARKFSSVSGAIDNVEQEPESEERRVALKEEVEKSGAAHDEELRALIGHLTKQLASVGMGSAGVSQNVAGNQNIFSGTGSVRVEQK